MSVDMKVGWALGSPSEVSSRGTAYLPARVYAEDEGPLSRVGRCVGALGGQERLSRSPSWRIRSTGRMATNCLTLNPCSKSVDLFQLALIRQWKSPFGSMTEKKPAEGRWRRFSSIRVGS